MSWKPVNPNALNHMHALDVRCDARCFGPHRLSVAKRTLSDPFLRRVFFFLNNTHFQTILLVSIISKLFRKLTSEVF